MNRGSPITEVIAVDPETRQHNGRRLVSFVTCEVCGAAIMRDPHDPIDALKLHNEWHTGQETKIIHE